MRSEDVVIDLQGKELRIMGEYGIAEQAGDQGDSEKQRVRRSGRFDYRLTLPGDVSSESCAANLEHGVLRLRLPKVPTGARHRIPGQAGPASQTGRKLEGGEKASRFGEARAA